ncbi:MAG: hypothetical protein ISS92_04755 [Candidatus Omnitrophica bacterium]|nr:hypothetical protein [Candidatus Omnitrophota bacterium]
MIAQIKIQTCSPKPNAKLIRRSRTCKQFGEGGAIWQRGVTEILTLFFIIIFLTGCGRVSENTLKDILEKDPSFERTLNQKKNINAKISSLRDNFNKEKDLTAQKIRTLKGALRTGKNNLDSQISLLKDKMKPKIHELKDELAKKRSEYKLKKKEITEHASKLKSIRKLLAKKGELSLSGDEISIWNKRVSSLEKEIDSLLKEIDKLRSKISLLGTEIKILKE